MLDSDEDTFDTHYKTGNMTSPTNQWGDSAKNSDHCLSTQDAKQLKDTVTSIVSSSPLQSTQDLAATQRQYTMSILGVLPGHACYLHWDLCASVEGRVTNSLSVLHSWFSYPSATDPQ